MTRLILLLLLLLSLSLPACGLSSSGPRPIQADDPIAGAAEQVLDRLSRAEGLREALPGLLPAAVDLRWLDTPEACRLVAGLAQASEEALASLRASRAADRPPTIVAGAISFTRCPAVTSREPDLDSAAIAQGVARVVQASLNKSPVGERHPRDYAIACALLAWAEQTLPQLVVSQHLAATVSWDAQVIDGQACQAAFHERVRASLPVLAATAPAEAP